MAPDAAIAFVILPWVMVLSAISSLFRLEASFFAFAILSLFDTLCFRWYAMTRSLFRSL